MRALLAASALAMLGGCSSGSPVTNAVSHAVDEAQGAPQSQPVMLTAEDGVKVYGDYTRVAHPKALILLFHQAGSSKDEYATIAPRLADAGYSTLAIDARAGGSMFGTNETVRALGHEGSYADAEKDLDAALGWAVNVGPPVILWGSSYSSSLVFLVAAAHPDEVAAVLSFSPGEYLGEGHPVRDAAAKVRVPVFVTSAQDPGEEAAARAIFDAVPVAAKKLFVPTSGGVHGSSTLIAARNPGGAEAAWEAVMGFLGTATLR